MSLIDVLMAAEASETGAAVRRTAYRHVHLEDEPLVVVAYNLSGEAAAPLGIMYGTDPDTPSLVVSAEPRNRESRFGAINAFAADFADYIKPHLTLKTVPTRDGSFRQVTSDAPQIVVPNRATRSYLGARLGLDNQLAHPMLAYPSFYRLGLHAVRRFCLICDPTGHN